MKLHDLWVRQNHPARRAQLSRITHIKTYDFRFPTSQSLSGSDAMNPDPDYASAYVEISTDADDGHTGIGFVFTIG